MPLRVGWWHLPTMVNLYSNSWWTTRKTFTTFCQSKRGYLQRCWTLFWSFASSNAIIVNPCHQWDYETIVDILMACVVIILHNTILEDDCDDDVKVIESNVGIQFWWGLSFVTFRQATKAIENYITWILNYTMILLKTCDNWKEIISKNVQCFSILWWCNCVLFQKFNYICIIVMLCFNKCIDRLKGGLWVWGKQFATNVEAIVGVTTFTRIETSPTSPKAPLWRQSLNFYNSLTCHSLKYSFTCLNIVGVVVIDNKVMVITSSKINSFFKVTMDMLALALTWALNMFYFTFFIWSNFFMAFDPCDLYVGVDFIIHVGLVCNLNVKNSNYVGWNFFVALEIFTLWWWYMFQLLLDINPPINIFYQQPLMDENEAWMFQVLLFVLFCNTFSSEDFDSFKVATNPQT